MQNTMDRRSFLHLLAGATLLGAVGTGCRKTQPDLFSGHSTTRLRGFNLLEKFTDSRNAPFRESDFALIKEWGFNFVRLPLSYWCWSGPDDWYRMDESVLREIDQAVEYGRQYGVHVNINFHRAPGYCVNQPAEPKNLWEDADALDAAAFHWKHFAERYQGIPSREVSFDLVNEPAVIPEEQYTRVVSRLVSDIREADPDRFIIADGLRWGRQPVPSLVDLSIGQSTRGYDPMRVSHYQASWVDASQNWDRPAWPLQVNGEVWDGDRLRKEIVGPFLELANKGVFVHVGEWGAYNKTPHDVALAWMEDFLRIWKDVGWGWALWNLRGSFGILDSGREDVDYEAFRDNQLDRQMLELLQRY